MRTALAGTLLQVAASALRHLFPGMAGIGSLFAHMMLAATAGYLYGLILGKGYLRGAAGGAISGGLSLVPAFLLSIVLGDSDGLGAAVATLIAVLTGAVGGAFGQMGAILRRLGY